MFEAQRQHPHHRPANARAEHQAGRPPCDDCPAGAFPLSMADCDQCVRLVAIHGGQRLRKRLADLGLNPGSTLRVVQRHRGGPMILAVKGDARMAIGRGMAHKILVTAEAEPPA